MFNWIACKDRMPEDGELVLFATIPLSGMLPIILLGKHDTSTKDGKGHWLTGISGFKDSEVGWWTPLPNPPELDYENSTD